MSTPSRILQAPHEEIEHSPIETVRGQTWNRIIEQVGLTTETAVGIAGTTLRTISGVILDTAGEIGQTLTFGVRRGGQQIKKTVRGWRNAAPRN